MGERRFNTRVAAPAAIYLAAWAGATAYLARSGADWTFPLVSMGVFGLALTGLAWLLTRGASPPEIPVRRPRAELTVLLVFLALYALVFLGWGLGALREAVPEPRDRESAILAAKLTIHVALPALILLALGARIAPLFDAGLRNRKFWRTLLVMGAVLLGLLALVSPSLRNIAALEPSLGLLAWAAPLCFIWLALEAGLCEEFLFRAVLQTRLGAVFRSTTAGIVFSSLLFALAHAPGLYLRGGPGIDGWSTDPLQVVAFTIATLSPVSILFGVLYARTKSLLLVVPLHASVDILPSVPEFIEIWAR